MYGEGEVLSKSNKQYFQAINTEYQLTLRSQEIIPSRPCTLQSKLYKLLNRKISPTFVSTHS